jgi:ABC-type lipopolysaccharide export system ATPase subunit
VFDEVSIFEIENFIADLDVNVLVNLISDHIGIQYLTVQQFAFILTAGPPK